MAAHKRRLIPIVDSRFQLKYTAIIMGVAAVVSTALGYFLWNANQEMNAMLATLTDSSLGDSLNADDAGRVWTMVVGFLVGEVIILGVLGIFVTHRVCGPIFVLKQHLSTLNKGSYPALRPLRSKDEFVDAFHTFAEFVTTLKQRDESEAKALNVLLAQAKERGDDEAATVLNRLIDERHGRLSPP